MNSRRITTALLLALLFVASQLLALDIPPKPTEWVTDRAGVLSSAERQALNEKLEAFAQRSGSQFLVFIFPSLEGEVLEDYTIRVAEQWKTKQDRALIIFVFVEDRKVRLEVGYGLEGSVPDGIAKRVIEQHIVPGFRSGSYAAGLNAGIDFLIARIEGRETAIEHEGGSGQPVSIGIGDIVPLIFIILIFLFVIGPMIQRSGCSGCGCLPFMFFPGGGGGTTFGGGGGGWSSGGGGGGWNIGGGWGGGGGGSFGGGGASGSW